MRKLFVILLMVPLILGCEPEEITFKGPFHVRFSESELTEKESFAQLIQIQIHNAGPQLNEDLSITYSISGDARENVDFEIMGTRGLVIIPENESFGFIDLQLINNANNVLESQQITFNITGVSSPNIEIGRSKDGIIGKSLTFTIIDDCILGGNFFGTSDPSDPVVEDITITSLDCIEYVLSNWDVNVFNFPSIRNLTFIDNFDNTITIPEQEESTLNDEQATISGNGSVDPITRVVTLNIELVDFEGSPIVTLTFTPY